MAENCKAHKALPQILLGKFTTLLTALRDFDFDCENYKCPLWTLPLQSVRPPDGPDY